MSTSTQITWAPAQFWHVKDAQMARIGAFELVVFDVWPATDELPPQIGWEIYGGPDLCDLVLWGAAATFQAAQERGVSACLRLVTP